MVNTVCKNCETNYQAKFCPECGQKSTVQRLSIGSIVHDILHYFTHADKGIFFTIKEMFRNPAFVIQEYIDGKRKKYFNPFTFVLIASTISAYLIYKLEFYQKLQIREHSAKTPNEISTLLQQTTVLLEQYGKLITIFMIPLLASISILFYFRKKLNYAEHLAVFAFVFAQINVVYIFITIFSYFLFPDQYFWANMLYQLTFLYFVSVVFSGLFKEHIIISVLKSIVIILLFIILFWIIALGLMYAYNQIV